MGRSVRIADVRVDLQTERSTVERVLSELEQGRGGLIVTVNLDHLRRCRADEDYAALVQGAELVVADGMPVVWASRVQGTPLPERVAGSNLVWSLAEACAARGRRVFLLGGDPGAAESAKCVLEKRYPGLVVSGVCVPERGFENDPERLGMIERAVIDARPDVVLIALGSPKQEYLARHLRAIVPSAWLVGVGISLSFVAGRVRRAPRWMQASGLEWLHRLLQEPRRLARRYLLDGSGFAVVLLGGSLMHRIRAAWSPQVVVEHAPAGPRDEGGVVFPDRARRAGAGASPGVRGVTASPQKLPSRPERVA